jgi:RNA polymerase sigma factor (sigma-70 family)
MYYKEPVTEDLTDAHDLSDVQFEGARLAFFGLLHRKGMHDLAETEGEDLFAQACFEYSRQRAEGKVIRNPVAWIVTCAWHRTVGMLETRERRPRSISTEAVDEIGQDEATPEEEFLSEDRHRKVREAVERLPDHQRRLLELAYFEGESVREAARLLGWTPSKAQRAHETARRRLRKMLAVDWSDELAIEVGLTAFLSVGGGGCARHLRLVGGIEGALDTLAHPAEIGRRVIDLVQAPFAHATSDAQSGSVGEVGVRALAGLHREPGSLAERAGRRLSDLGARLFTSGAAQTTAAAAEGGGRTLEVCKAIAAACVIGGGAVTGALIVGGGEHAATVHRAPDPRQVAARSPHPRHGPPPAGELVDGQASEEPQTATAGVTAQAFSASPDLPVERHQQAEHRRPEPEVKKAKPPPTEPEGEFEPSPEAATAEPEPVVEPVTTTTEAKSTVVTSPSSSNGSGAKPKAVPANSPGEFEP